MVLDCSIASAGSICQASLLGQGVVCAITPATAPGSTAEMDMDIGHTKVSRILMGMEHYAKYLSSTDERHEDEDTLRHCVGCVMPIISSMLSFPWMCTAV